MGFDLLWKNSREYYVGALCCQATNTFRPYVFGKLLMASHLPLLLNRLAHAQ